ncbi:cyclase family protein [Leptolyngbya sp. FACHB-261]|uniref:cyclase family protein n=1 Tax=Leptolyngbya sp. FACHB-261 TaxID=2692806 RepID=UPI001684FC56|nr:cyclase family protein [Leptolyngbya sp. FACHB-261]MBD2099882.1 cyclase family protein [Leptolyngbya sp. FACHB-261]
MNESSWFVQGLVCLNLLLLGSLLVATRARGVAFVVGNQRQRVIRYQRIIELSHQIHPQIPQWPGDPPVVFEPVAELAKEGYYLRRFSIGEHSATHMNAPNSFYREGTGIDAYSAESLVVPAIVIDIRNKTTTDSDYTLTQADVLAWEEQYGRLAPGSVVLLHTGWQTKWADPHAFFNQDAEGGSHFPGFSGDTTRFLLARGIAGVGIDTHGVDSGQDEAFSTNKQVLAQSGIVLENLTQLDQLPAKGTTLVIGILRLQDGSGSPVSVLAFVP